MAKHKQMSINDIDINDASALTDQERQTLQQSMGMDKESSMKKKAM